MAINRFLKKAHSEDEFDAVKLLELEKCANDPLYFMRQYVKIQHPVYGIVPFDLYDYQEELIEHIHANKDSLVLMSRQCGKCVINHTLITVCTKPQRWYKIALLWLLDRWLYENDSKLHGKLTYWALDAQEITIEDFHQAHSPQATQIDGLNGQLKFIEQSSPDGYLVKTDTGWSAIKSSFKTVPYQIYEVKLVNGLSLKCADAHIVFDEWYNEIFVKDLRPGIMLHTERGLSPVLEIIAHPISNEMYDLELDDFRHRFYTNGILSHNTICAAIYILWYASFKKVQNCTIASKDMNHATDILARIKFSYEELPNWLKPGVKFYNRTSIEFDNGSIIKSLATTEKTGRGGSPSILMLDEISFVRKNIQDKLWASIAPSLSTGGKLILTTTPSDDADLFATLWRGAVSGINNFKHLMILYTRHPERGPNSGYREEMEAKLGELRCKVELDCCFISTDELLINSLRLNEFKACHYIYEDNGFKFWEQLNQSPMYLVGADISTGSSQDYSVIQVFDFPGLSQIAQYRSNTLHIPELYDKIKWIVNKLSQPVKGRRAEVLWTFERNAIGEAISALYSVDEFQPEHGDLVNDIPGKIGMVTTNKSKVLACLQLKSLVEKIKNGLIIHSDIDIFELKNFVSNGAGYSAKQGCTDDCVSALLLIVRLIRYVATFDKDAHKIIYEYNKSDYECGEEEDMDEPMAVVFG